MGRGFVKSRGIAKARVRSLPRNRRHARSMSKTRLLVGMICLITGMILIIIGLLGITG